MKDMFEVWETPRLLKMIDEQRGVLIHENDGLIFTLDACPYYPGTCNEIIKWKPVHMNTIDFKFFPIDKEFAKDSNGNPLALWGLNVLDRNAKNGQRLFDFFMFGEE